MQKSQIFRFLGFLLLLGTKLEAEEFQYWQRATYTTYEDEKWRLYIYAEERIRDNPCCLNAFFFSPIMFRYRVNDNLDFEAHYTFIEARNADFSFSYRNRLELEINPSWKLDSRLTFSMRNRYELIQFQDSSSFQQRVRCRPRLTMAWSPVCWIESYSINDEFFYDINRREITINRFVPLEIRTNLTNDIAFSPFIMWEARKEERTWLHRFILGSQIDF